ncbi:MAG: glutamate--tRNA ligase family protein, partial [Methyloligellaceae bacterium]
ERGLLFPCFATRREIAERIAAAGTADPPKDPDGAPLYPGLYRGAPKAEVERRLAAGEAHALRIDIERALAQARETAGGDIMFTELTAGGRTETPRTADPSRWGDTVIVRKDAPTSYHLSVVVDDALQGITHVTRGLDLFAATDVHRLLQILLDLPEPLYHHHGLITDADGRKLSKSHEDRSLRSLRGGGATPDDIRRMVGLPQP